MSFVHTIRSLLWHPAVRRGLLISCFIYGAVSAMAQDQEAAAFAVYTQPLSGWVSEPHPYHWRPDNTLEIQSTIFANDRYDTPITVLYNPYRSMSPLTHLSPSSDPTEEVRSEWLPEAYDRVFSISLDGRFELSMANEMTAEDNPNYPYGTLRVLDHTSGDSVIVPEARFNKFPFKVQWSANNTALLLAFSSDYGGSPFYLYMSGFGQDVSQIRLVPLNSGGAVARLLRWDVYEVYDLDSTGQYVLVDGYTYNPRYEPRFMRLIVINMEDYSYELVAESRYFATASFEQPGGRQVFYVNEAGTFAYDRETKTRQVLTKVIDSNVLERRDASRKNPLFSPDGRYLAAELEDDDRNLLYVFPLPPALKR